MRIFRIFRTLMFLPVLSFCLPAEAYDRDWTVYLVHHSHTDIGYTRPQAEIIAEHLRYIDYAVDYCEMTEDYPEDSRFRWTCESAWVVARYLESRPDAQVARFLKYVRNGQIEVAAMCFNMAETADENSLRRSLEPLADIRSYGIKSQVAMQNDVNGIAWSFADWFPDLGVKYLWMGEHEHKAFVPFDKPSVFKWMSPSGSSLTAVRAEHYMTGNFWGIEKCDERQFSSSLDSYLQSLVDRHYQFDAVAIQYSGAYTDNAPPSVKICDFIRTWNETHDNPKLRTAVCHEFPEYIEGKYADLLREFPHAYPDWWTDGFASAALETGVARNTGASLTATEGLAAQAAACGEGIPDRLSEKVSGIDWDLLFYNEHTFGASESISDPLCRNSRIQWMGKASYAWNAERESSLLREDALARLQQGLSDPESPVLAVFNPLAWRRDGYADVFVDYEVAPAGRPFRVLDEKGRPVAMQTLSSRNEGRVIRFYVKDIPALGSKTYRIDASEGTVPEAVQAGYGNGTLENKYYRVTVDASTGTISGIWDKVRKTEMVSSDARWGLGSLIYETLKDRWSLTWRRGEGLDRTGWSGITVGAKSEGEVYDCISITGSSPAADGSPVKCEIRLYKDSPRLELAYSIRRARNFSADAIYVAFPFDGDSKSLYFDVQGGEVRPGINQLEGTSSAWNTVQNYVAVRTPDASGQVIFCCPDTPIVQLGSMLGGPFQYIKSYRAPHVYSWVMNNYWTTNFKAEQEGEFTWRYVISSSADDGASAALKAAMEDRMQPSARVLPASSGFPATGRAVEGDILELTPETAVPLDVYPTNDGKYLMVYFRETSGKDAEVKAYLRGKVAGMQVTDALGQHPGKTARKLKVKALSNTLVRIKL